MTVSQSDSQFIRVKEVCGVMTDVLFCIFLFHENQLIHLTNKAFWKLLNQELSEELLLNFSGVHICAYIYICEEIASFPF